ncbi:hypothetical protein M2334_002250 [Sphingobium sp. B11D3D]|nr:UvrB/UvrC motif-containing protein [Sphingobium sp. B11D3D]MCW2370051.1 hypothetical protein [Sphingobium sp. B11D3D]
MSAPGNNCCLTYRAGMAGLSQRWSIAARDSLVNEGQISGSRFARPNGSYVGVCSLIRGRAFRGMEETLESLQHKMEEAARALDFEEAKRCRDRISLMRSGASAVDAAQADFAGLERQQPGAMGLGTS